LEEEISKYRRQILDWEKRYADKEAEFARYKEREHTRPEVKLQSEINILNLEKVRKLVFRVLFWIDC
jgi:centrosomal protein CEP120